MGRRLFSVILLALLVAVVVFFYSRMYAPQPAALVAQGQSAPQNQNTELVQLIVAAKDLPSGTLIQPNALVFKPWPKASVDDMSHIVEGKGTVEEFNGAVVRSGLRSGEPVPRANLIKRGESGFLAAVLKPGFRAIALPVSENTGVAGFVFPADYVDLIMSHTVRILTTKGEEQPHKVSETILHDLRVLAVDQKSGDQEQNPAVSRVVTLEVSPEQAEKIALAQQLGQVSLSLRPLAQQATDAMAQDTASQQGDALMDHAAVSEPTADVEEVKPTMTLDSELSQIITPPPSGVTEEGSKSGAIQVIRGSTASSVEIK